MQTGFPEVKKKLGFGAMRLPMIGEKVDLAAFSKMVDLFLSEGFNYFDTAHPYLNGESELALREALTSRYPREAYLLANKLTAPYFDQESDIRPFFEKQLQWCGVSYFDFYLMHAQNLGNYDKFQRCHAYETAFALKKEGKIRHVGLSFHDKAEVLERILGDHPDVEFVQIQMNYADWDNPLIQSGRLYEVLRKYDMPFLVMEPVKGGSLASAGKEIEAEMKRVHPDASIASWALRFAASLPGVATVLSGMSNEEQMEDNIKTFRNFVPLNEEEKAVIAKAQEALKKSPAVPCTACRYCCDGCPMGIAIPDVFKALNTIRLYGEEDRAKNYYKKLLETSGKAEDCVQCGQCESVCPQHLPIIDLLKEASEKLDVPVTE